MNERSLVYVGPCPVCEGGLCRVRICGVDQNQIHGLVICDECEAIWLEPDLSLQHRFLSAELPCSPITGESIWSEKNRWATLEDVCLLGWYDRVFLEPQVAIGNSIAFRDGAEILDEPKPGC